MRVLIVRRHEDDRDVAADQLEHLEAVELRHLHVEEQQIGMQLGRPPSPPRSRWRTPPRSRRRASPSGTRAAPRAPAPRRRRSRRGGAARRRQSSVGAGQRQLDAERPRLGAGVEPRVARRTSRVSRWRTLSRPTPRCRPRGASASRGFSIAIDSAVPARDVEPDHAALEQAGNAVRDGVLDERLQEQRRHAALRARRRRRGARPAGAAPNRTCSMPRKRSVSASSSASGIRSRALMLERARAGNRRAARTSAARRRDRRRSAR